MLISAFVHTNAFSYEYACLRVAKNDSWGKALLWYASTVMKPIVLRHAQ